MERTHTPRLRMAKRLPVFVCQILPRRVVGRAVAVEFLAHPVYTLASSVIRLGLAAGMRNEGFAQRLRVSLVR